MLQIFIVLLYKYIFDRNAWSVMSTTVTIIFQIFSLKWYFRLHILFIVSLIVILWNSLKIDKKSEIPEKLAHLRYRWF